ncbi:MAG: GspE/PulE family protein [Phycisphaerales bacterium]|nr:GspE/PulE family protein [Phycisphaerales bacterium]
MIGHDDFVLAAMVEENLLEAANAEKVRQHAAEHGGSPSESVIALGLLDARSVALVKAQVSECPFVDIGSYNIRFGNAALLPREAAESLCAFPLFVCDEIATVGMADPLDLRAVDQLRGLLKQDIDPVLCEPGALAALIERAYSLAGATTRVDASVAGEDRTTGKEPIVAAVNQILAQGLDLGASDIHISPDAMEMQLRYRVDGSLVAVQGPSIDLHAGIVQRLKVMADLDVTQSRRPQDGKFRFSQGGRSVDVRLSLIPTVCGENAVLRLLSSASAIRGFVELGFPQDRLATFERIIDEPHGMVLVTGPTGSGKTTTLYTALKKLNTSDVNIMTIEDPVEIRMPMVRQIQVNASIGMTFASALRSVLRQDPDVVFVGEIRDEETARISIQAALTGHLVLSSLHTNDAAGAIPRLRDLSCPPFAINAALLCVIAQRLVRRVCPHCAKPASVPSLVAQRFGIDPGEPGHVRGTGCGKCGGAGTRGRLGIYEMLTMSAGVRRAIERGASASEIAEAAAADGMRPMCEDGLAKARLGLTTLEEVSRVATVISDDELERAETRAAA